MVIFVRTFDFLDWLLVKAEGFPKTYRQSVTRRLVDAALDFQELLYDAQMRTGNRRVQTLREADAALGKVRLYLRLVHRWGWLSDGQYRHVSAQVAELGRLLGGWLKAG
jgi:hypothetical protein